MEDAGKVVEAMERIWKEQGFNWKEVKPIAIEVIKRRPKGMYDDALMTEIGRVYFKRHPDQVTDDNTPFQHLGSGVYDPQEIDIKAYLAKNKKTTI